MKRTKEIARKIARKIYTGLGLTTVALVFQACYGTPQAMGLDVLIRGTVKSTTNEPIEGIKVSVKDAPQHELTDSAGTFQIYVSREDSYTIQFDDIDGVKNGSYQSKEMRVSSSKNEIDVDIALDAE
jgi:putative lipoprotein (rSAM/lipoprotein system)